MKRILTVMMMAVGMAAFAATPTVSNVKAQQRYPWNALVDIDYTITGDTTGLDLSFSVRDEQNNKTYTPVTFLFLFHSDSYWYLQKTRISRVRRSIVSARLSTQINKKG